ncbi:hypothetical protein Nepgr_025766 [Nepenthes gracilis]|uniref:non-specific serine/threonine protein kinase n=1 Tax=Nepenthes gracilis TaxID=150966 RepID=A0AAD3XZZ9_NEPGR|nr:hypothetical protein Nepgr_025766 [Nepenthes gracilis]
MVPFFVFTLLSVLSTSFSSSSTLLADFHALLSLKQGFEFTSPALDSWESSNSNSVCSWAGVRCLHGRVISLDLTDLNLSGSVSPAIFQLEELLHLSLAGNNLTGSIQMGNFSSLKFLNISNNQFNGSLDWNYSSLADLEVIDTNDNNLSGPLPLGILTLKKLKHLDLGGNYFHGEIPSSYGHIAGLEYLFLAGNDLRGRIPTDLGNLTNLRELYLGYYNVFEGGIPQEFGKLVNLVHLDLSNCGLDGQIPPELGNLKLLDTLYLDFNQLSGPIPWQLGNLSNLINLDLSNNALTGEIPSEFVNLKQLGLINLFLNRLHGSIPNYFAELPDLKVLGLWMNNFTGMIPQNLGRNGKLQELDLSSNKLTGTIPPNLCASNQLRILILFKNFLFGPVPETLRTCSSLVRVRLGQNYLNGSLPDGFIYLPQLNLLELQSNYLSGNLSENGDSSSKPVKLEQLDLSNNLISGSLPFSLSNLSSLQILSVGGNQFSGAIPPSIGKLQLLFKFDASKNSLSGQIPPEIGNCVHLTFLDLSQNNLSGQIPPEISDIRILNYLNLSRNHFDGPIPRSIGSMKSLTNADFSFNELSGRLPEPGQFSLLNASSFTGNPQLCGSLLNNPCKLTQTADPAGKSDREFKLFLAFGFLICSLIFAFAALIKAKSFKKGQDSSSSWKMTVFGKVEFTVSDILECVKDGNVIGRGGAGIVYHGKMPNGEEIAVKKLLGFGPDSHDHGFRAEIQTLGNIRHRNIVRLIAFCSNKQSNLLVYEYMKNGSLGEALHSVKKKKVGGGCGGGCSFLGWHLRYKIAVEAARGLCYLHHDCHPLIVHRDVKSNNILLDSSFEAHVADFGLAKFLTAGGTSECMSAIAGSYGYIAPEYAYTLRVNEKSDVYSFGVVMLELLTGRRPVGEFDEGVDIVQWCKIATKCNKIHVLSILDPRLTTTVALDEAKHFFFIAMQCVQENSVERPTMREVVQMLSEFSHHTTVTYLSPSSSLLDHKPDSTRREKTMS